MNTQNTGRCDIDQEKQHKMQDMEINDQLKRIKNKILVMSGKGGVGKSSVASYVALTLAHRGYKVGLMDVDLHGPSIPHILGIRCGITPGSAAKKARPVKYLPNMEVISIEVLMGDERDRATIWRGPLKIGVIRQFISDIEWSTLDYLVIDSPPGTGDEPLTVAQTIPDAKALIVTTPQEISLADVRKSINFCRQVNMDILGLVENMSGLTCPHCGETIEIFKSRGGMLTAKNEGLPFLGTLPIDPEVVADSDAGETQLLQNSGNPFSAALHKLVDEIESRSVKEEMASPAGKKAGQPEKMPEGGNGKRLAIPVSGGKLSSHFGHSEQFAFIDTSGGEIRSTDMRTPPAHEPGSIPSWIRQQGADVVIAGGMGKQAQNLLEDSGIEVIMGAPMDPPETLANQYLNGTLMTGSNMCDH